jgi:hypothetical protein
VALLALRRAGVAKLADASDLGSGGAILRGSSPLPGKPLYLSLSSATRANPHGTDVPALWLCMAAYDTSIIGDKMVIS